MAGSFKDGDNEGSSVIWIAPNSGGEVVITSTADNSQSSEYPDGSVSDSIIVLVVSVDLDIWNGLTSGIGDPVPDIGRLLLYLKIFVFPLDIRGSNINNDHNKQEIANGIDNNNDVSMLHV